MGLSLGFSNDTGMAYGISGMNARKVQDFMDLGHLGTVWGLAWEAQMDSVCSGTQVSHQSDGSR